jgi:hypothetical protein
MTKKVNQHGFLKYLCQLLRLASRSDLKRPGSGFAILSITSDEEPHYFDAALGWQNDDDLESITLS